MYNDFRNNRDRYVGARGLPVAKEGMEMNQHQHSAPGYTPSGYLTPGSSSTAYEGRRDSIASMQSSASCANSFSSNSSAYYSNLPPTPHTSREVVGDGDWMMVRPNEMSFDHGSSHTANDHDADDYNSQDTWPPTVDFPHAKPGRIPGIPAEQRSNSWVMVDPGPAYTSAVRPTGSDSDTLLPVHTEYPTFDSIPPAQRTLLPPAELHSHSEMWNAHNPTTSALSLQGMTAEAYGAPPMNNGGLNMEYTWPHVGANLEMPLFQDNVVHPEDTVHETDNRTPYPEINSDQSLEDSFGSYDGYSSSTSQCSRYGRLGGDAQPSIKREVDDTYLDHRSRSDLLSPQRRHRQKDRRIGPSGPSGITKRKHRCENRMMEAYTANLDGCAVDIQFQSDIQKDPKSGKYCSTAGETKKQRCRFEGCTKTFARPEHLKRHENTHSKERPFPCVVPGCGRRFSRNDNRKAHYETHLKEAMSGKKARNASVSFGELKDLLHSHESPEEASKMIEKLQNPKVKVKHEKSDSR